MTLFNTPMLKQYKQIKDQYPDTLLLFRLGDFYELFDADAIVVSQALSLTLTGRGKDPNRISMCGMPYHAADKYINQLLEQGFKVALCDQVGESESGLADRRVTQVLTPGTVSRDSTQSNFLISVIKVNQTAWAYSFADISTGGVCYCGWTTLQGIKSLTTRYQIKELLIQSGVELEPLKIDGVIITQQPAINARQETAIVQRVFGEHWIKRFGLEGFTGTRAIAQLLLYSQETQNKLPLHITRVYFQHSQDTLIMNDATLDSLGLIRHKAPDSLFTHLNHTKTPMGARYLQYRIMNPYRAATVMRLQWDSVQALGYYSLCDDIITALTPIQDMNRLATRLNNHTLGPKDCRALAGILGQVKTLKPILEKTQDTQLNRMAHHIGVACDDWLDASITLIDTALADEPPVSIQKGNAIRPGYDAELDALIQSFEAIRVWIDQLEARERTRTGIKSLKVGYNKVFGYYIECPKQYDNLPEYYKRQQTLSQAERYITTELKEKETVLLTGQAQQFDREKQVYDAVITQLSRYVKPLQALARIIGQIDVIQALATVARLYGYTRPVISDTTKLSLTGSYHPILAAKSDTPFIPNDITLETGGFGLITGPNMAGKSTLMRQVALCVIMAQVGGYVPAKQCEFSPVDYLFTRIGASDNLYEGQSTFMVEMLETAAILHQATDQSLIILDEIGRGTATYDGLSIATAIARYIHDKLKSRTLFATHYHELVDRLNQEGNTSIQCYHMGILEENNQLLFTYKLKPGHIRRSYGINVAALAGIPEAVIQHAKTILDELTCE